MPKLGGTTRQLSATLTAFLLAVLLSLSASTVTVANDQSVVPHEAQIVLDRYVAALQTGDISDLGNLYGGALKARRQHLLNSPDYGQRLREKHNGAVLQVISVESVNNELIRILVEIQTADETIRKQLFLSQQAPTEGTLGFRIIEERVSM